MWCTLIVGLVVTYMTKKIKVNLKQIKYKKKKRKKRKKEKESGEVPVK